MLTLKTYIGREIENSKAVKAVLIGLRQFWATESPLKIIKNAFFFTSKVLFIFKIFKCLSWFFSHVAKQLD